MPLTVGPNTTKIFIICFRVSNQDLCQIEWIKNYSLFLLLVPAPWSQIKFKFISISRLVSCLPSLQGPGPLHGILYYGGAAPPSCPEVLTHQFERLQGPVNKSMELNCLSGAVTGNFGKLNYPEPPLSSIYYVLTSSSPCLFTLLAEPELIDKNVAPNVGLKPTTLRLRVSCSTDWASRAGYFNFAI